MVIIAGYEDQLQECFFEANQGLESRFAWRFHTDKYNADELRQIFIKKVKEIKWTLAEDALLDSRFGEHVDDYASYGRDMESLLSKVKIAHSRRVFTLAQSEKTCITADDVNNGLDIFLKHKKTREKFKGIEAMYT